MCMSELSAGTTKYIRDGKHRTDSGPAGAAVMVGLQLQLYAVGDGGLSWYHRVATSFGSCAGSPA